MQYITLSCDSSAKWQVRMNLDYLWSRKLNICSYLTVIIFLREKLFANLLK